MLAIGSFSKICNVSTKTLRYYDEIGLLKPMYIDQENNYRYYKVDQLKDYLLINKLKNYHLSLDEIAKVINHAYTDEKLITLLSFKKNELEETINNYKGTLEKLDEDINNIEKGIDIMSYLDNIDVKIITREATPIISVREMVDYTNPDGFSHALMKCFTLIKESSATPIGAPMAIYHGKEFIEDGYDTEIAIPIMEEDKKTRTMDGSLCAMSVLKGPYSELQSIYAKLRNWIEEEGYVLNGAPFDIYATDPSNTKPEDYITEVYFPITK